MLMARLPSRDCSARGKAASSRINSQGRVCVVDRAGCSSGSKKKKEKNIYVNTKTCPGAWLSSWYPCISSVGHFLARYLCIIPRSRFRAGNWVDRRCRINKWIAPVRNKWNVARSRRYTTRRVITYEFLAKWCENFPFRALPWPTKPRRRREFLSNYTYTWHINGQDETDLVHFGVACDEKTARSSIYFLVSRIVE